MEWDVPIRHLTDEQLEGLIQSSERAAITWAQPQPFDEQPYAYRELRANAYAKLHADLVEEARIRAAGGASTGAVSARARLIVHGIPARDLTR